MLLNVSWCNLRTAYEIEGLGAEVFWVVLIEQIVVSLKDVASVESAVLAVFGNATPVLTNRLPSLALYTEYPHGILVFGEDDWLVGGTSVIAGHFTIANRALVSWLTK